MGKKIEARIKKSEWAAQAPSQGCYIRPSGAWQSIGASILFLETTQAAGAGHLDLQGSPSPR